jgi:hypothetical protein
MRIDFRITIVILLFLTSGLGLTWADAPEGMCCYVPGSDRIQQKFGECGEGEVGVGDFSNNPMCDYANNKKGCVKDDECYGIVSGNYIFDFPGVMSFFESDVGIDLDSYCDSLVDFDTEDYDCTQELNNWGGDITVGGGDDDGSGTDRTQVGDRTDPEDFKAEEDLHRKQQDIRACGDVGSPYGLFATKDECNSLEFNGRNPCLYNPYYAGNLKVSFVENDFGIFHTEIGCMAKSEIRSCFDYKTKENCQKNPANEGIYRRPNLESCTWVDTSTYYDRFNVSSGICISTAVNDNKHFDIEKFTSRQNLLKNPSFEDGQEHWNGDFTVESNKHSFDRDNRVFLPQGSKLSQGISYLAQGVGYRTVLYLMQNSSFQEGDEIFLSIAEMDNNGDTINDDNVYSVLLDDYKNFNGVFNKVDFGEHVISEGTSKLLFKIYSNRDVVIDAISFEKYMQSNPLTGEGVFKPLTIVDAKASMCENCFDDRNLDFCTKEKSDLLGDCSYMVDDLSNSYSSPDSVAEYIGEFENPYLDNWSSQSLAYSKLFCGLYLTQDMCEDENNYINRFMAPLHGLVSGNLCQWSDSYGCFKDSDDSGGPDTTNGGEVYLFRENPSDLSSFGWNSTRFETIVDSGYVRETDLDESKISDFEYECDTIPPQSYIYFRARNASGSWLNITEDFPDEIIGNIKIYIEAYDVSVDACKEFNIGKELYVDFYVNDNVSAWKYDSAYFKDSSDVKEYFTSADELLLEEGNNEVGILVKDQSGNIGEFRKYEFTADLRGPDVSMDSRVSDSTSYLGPDTILDINVTDFSGFDDENACEFTLEPVSNAPGNEDIEDSFYNSSGNLSDFSQVVDITDGKNYKFNLPIYETGDNGNVYYMTLTCTDKFGQETQEEYPIYVDFDTSFVIIEPIGFQQYDLDSGFLNSSVNFHAVSSDMNLNSCSFNPLGSSFNGSVDNVVNYDQETGPFSAGNYDDVFYTNITGIIDFSSDGFKEIQIVCEDDLGNQMTENLSFYYDTQAPEMVEFSIRDTDSSTKNLIEYQGDYYMRSLNEQNLEGIINVSVDGTGSWMSNENLNWTYFNSDSTEYKDGIGGVNFGDFDLNNESFIADVDISSFSNLLVYAGEEIGNDVFEQKYRVSFSDKAGNSGFGDIKVYFDNSVPSFKFEEPIFRDGNNLYTNVLDPQMDIGFNTAEYRKFNCSIDANWRGNTFTEDFNEVSNLNFQFSNFIVNFNFDVVDTISFDLSCIDVYGVNLNGNFVLKYDNSTPQISDVYLKNQDKVFLPNMGGNMVYFSDSSGVYLDSLVFEMNDTGEENYVCNYSLSSDDYTCDESIYGVSFSDTYYESSPISILSNEQSGDGVCYMDDTFNNRLSSAYQSEDDLNTTINFQVKCFDVVGLETQTKTIPLNIDYIGGDGFVDFEVSYENSKAVFTTKSLSPFNSVGVYFDQGGEEFITNLTQNGQENGLFLYRGEISMSEFEDSNNEFDIWAIGFGSGSSIWDTIQGSLLIDKLPPKVEMNVPDADNESKIYSPNFEVDFDAQDVGGSNLGKIEFYVNGERVYDSLDLENHDSGIISLEDFENYYFEDDRYYQGRVYIEGAVIGETYQFKVVAYDKSGNVNESIMNFRIVDGISIELLDSDDSFASESGMSWITKSNAPEISFRTSRESQECRLHPFSQDEWMSVLDNSDARLIKEIILGSEVTDNTYSFDLSSFSGFNINSLNRSETMVLIRCKYNDSFYDFNRRIYKIDKLPDYVVESSEGFILNEEPFETTINITGVGFYKYMTCDYSIDGGSTYTIAGGYREKFSTNIDFSSLSEGEHTLEVVCENKLDVRGPRKSYSFIVNKDIETDISEVNLMKGSRVKELAVDEESYINERDGYDMSFRTNKKDISCSVEVENSNNIFTKVMSFIANLFVDNNIEIESGIDPYLFESTQTISFAEGLNRIVVECDGMTDKEYEVRYIDELSGEISLSIK